MDVAGEIRGDRVTTANEFGETIQFVVAVLVDTECCG